MALFGKGKSGGMMNVIRCDEPEYLIWKWRPLDQDVNSTTRENAIRYGSSLRVKDGEVAVFVYRQKEGPMQDFIMGPYDDTIKTANFPVLSSLVGMAFGGESPFQAEIYFINLAGNVQIKFGIPYFDVFDPRLPDSGIPFGAGGTMTFNITDYQAFIKLHRLINFDLDDFKEQIKDAVIRTVKSVLINVPDKYQIPAVQMAKRIDEINDFCKDRLKTVMEEDFGVNLKRIDISRIEPDKDSEGWKQVNHLTAGQQARTIEAQTDVNVQNLQDMQRINASNMEETMRIQREEAQRAQRLQTESNYMGAHALDQQTAVLGQAAQSLGSMGAMGGGGGSMNPAGMMTGMMMGGAMGQQMAAMMSQMGGAMNGQFAQAAGTPPPAPQVAYHISVNGQQMGPCNMQQLQQMAGSGQLTAQTMVWKQGMAGWEAAGNVAELAALFAPVPPPPAAGGCPPPPPGMPPVPPTA